MEAAACPLHILGHQTGLVLDVILELAAEMLEETLDRQGRRIAEGTDGATHDVAQHAVQQVQVFRLAQSVLDAMDHLVHPGGAFPAGCALAAGFFVIEEGQSFQGLHHTHRFVHDDDRAGAEHGTGFGDGVVIHGGLHHHIAGNDRC